MEIVSNYKDESHSTTVTQNLSQTTVDSSFVLVYPLKNKHFFF
jgi:hypothetical protein